MSEKAQTLPLGEPRPADVAHLEAALSALWRSAAEDPSTRDAVTRACALTLLVYVESEQEAQEVSHLVSAVTEQNPCRAIVIVAEPQATPSRLLASISAHCHLPAPGAKQVCCEQVTLLARGAAVEDLDNVVLPLTVSGLPVHLWWRAAGFSPPPYFNQILRVSDHVLLDSARLANAEAELPSLAAQIQQLSESLVITDLNWARITPRRELIAQFFDSVETRHHLDFLSEIQIEYNPAAPGIPARRGRLMLLTGWLASRLNWEPVGRSGDPCSEARSFRFKSGQGFVDVHLRSGRHDAGDPAVTFTLISRSPIGAATFVLASALGRKSIVTRVELSGRPPVERTVYLPLPDEVALVNEELKVVSRDTIYYDTLQMVARMTSL